MRLSISANGEMLDKKRVVGCNRGLYLFRDDLFPLVMAQVNRSGQIQLRRLDCLLLALLGLKLRRYNAAVGILLDGERLSGHAMCAVEHAKRSGIDNFGRSVFLL